MQVRGSLKLPLWREVRLPGVAVRCALPLLTITPGNAHRTATVTAKASETEGDAQTGKRDGFRKGNKLVVFHMQKEAFKRLGLSEKLHFPIRRAAIADGEVQPGNGEGIPSTKVDRLFAK